MDNPYLPALTAIKSQIAAKEAELAPLRQQLAAKEGEITPLKITANELCKLAGIQPEFSIDAAGTPAAAPNGSRIAIRPDQFFNKDLSEAVVEYLTAKKAANGNDHPTPGTVDEIYTALVNGGFKFNGTSDANKKAALKTALTRNTTQMVKISDDLYGLRKWYGMRASRRGSGGSDETPTNDSQDAAESDAVEPNAKSDTDRI